MRLDHRLASVGTGRISVYGRTSAALGNIPQPEAALGIAVQPHRALPLTFGAERRISLGEGARDAFAVIMATGIGPVTLPLGLRVEGYGQTGVVGFSSANAFVDGKLSLLGPLAETMAGVSVSGGAQPNINRLDIGPEVQFRLPIGNRAGRISAE